MAYYCRRVVTVVTCMSMPHISRGAFIIWAVSKIRKTEDNQPTGLAHITGVLHIIVTFALETRDVTLLRPNIFGPTASLEQYLQNN